MKISPTLSEAMMLSELGARVQHYRVGMNITQAELAKDAGVSQRTVERLEAGSSVQLDKSYASCGRLGFPTISIS